MCHREKNADKCNVKVYEPVLEEIVIKTITVDIT